MVANVKHASGILFIGVTCNAYNKNLLCNGYENGDDMKMRGAENRTILEGVSRIHIQHPKRFA